MSKSLKQDALDYHSQGRPGKIEVVPTKPYSTQRDLTLAYSPGVAEPCLEIEKNQEDAYKYTAKGNLVAVISNGTAVLGLGDIGALASKPVRTTGYTPFWLHKSTIFWISLTTTKGFLLPWISFAPP